MNDKLEMLRSCDEYRELLQERAKIKWPLAIAMFLAYYVFVIVIAFEPEVFATKIGSSHASLGIVVGFGVILFSFLVTGLYVSKANKILEPLTKKLHEKAGDLS